LNAPDRCLDLEILSAFVEGVLDEETVADVIRHLAFCAKCRLVVERAAAIEEEDEYSGSWWKVAVAASVIVFAILGAWVLLKPRPTAHPDPIRMMASTAPKMLRNVEPRLTGGFRWAPYRNVMADVRNKSAEELVAGGVAAQVLRDLKDDKSARALHAKAIACLVRDNAAAAVSLLRVAARLDAGDARVWNDLAAALYIDAQVDAELHEALGAARRAIRLDPRLSEAYFNVALILERVGTKQEIKSAWIEYLRHDPSRGWSEEARDRLTHYEDGN
jgi:tetratricopeptide (TPR) repeat protein